MKYKITKLDRRHNGYSRFKYSVSPVSYNKLQSAKDLVDAIPDDDSASKQERLLLYQIIRNIKPKVAVEIGTHRGKAAFYMAQALKDNGEGILHTGSVS